MVFKVKTCAPVRESLKIIQNTGFSVTEKYYSTTEKYYSVTERSYSLIE